MATTFKIHPAIGIARLGDSPSDFFIGPEVPGVVPAPQGGYKDAACRVKRQAARFRVMKYENGVFAGEVTPAVGTITWKVRLANRKAAAANFDGPGLRNSAIVGPARNDLVIDPLERTLDSPNKTAAFDNGTFKYTGAPGGSGSRTVYLGEIRTDTDGRLLVLGGHGVSGSPTNESLGNNTFNNDWWHDDTADGYVKATVSLNGGGGGDAEGAWVIIAPPDFAPYVKMPVTMWDRLYALWNAAPAKPSFTRDIYPILQRALDSKWVFQPSVGVHGDFSSASFTAGRRQAIYDKLKQSGVANNGALPPDGKDMPFLWDDVLDPKGDELTSVQLANMLKWTGVAGVDWDDDWAGVPVPSMTITPDGLDRAALEACVGAAFYPGIEAGTFVLDTSKYASPFRWDHAKVQPGDVTALMALPWQTDFYQCREFQNLPWWPAQRPLNVKEQSSATYQAWDRNSGGISGMVTNWSKMGFVVPQGAEQVETERCDIASVLLRTPSLNFSAEEGPGGAARTVSLPVVFEVLSPSSQVVLDWNTGPGNPQLARVTVGPNMVPATSTPKDTLFWVSYTTGAVGPVVTDTVTFKMQGSGATWSVPITAVTTARTKTVVGLVLDRSGSMTEDRGDGQPKINSLLDAAKTFINVMLQDDAVAIVRYNDDAQMLLDVTALGDPADASDPGRTAALGKINPVDLAATGATSIGDGIHTARLLVNAAAAYPEKALVVLTDGKENRPASIADVSADIDARVYAVGLGRPENISVPALQTLSGNNGGYLLVTGDISGDNKNLLTKYFVQILAGVTNAQVILDPTGVVDGWSEQRIPFQVSDADHGIDVILLVDDPRAVQFVVETPAGAVVDPAMAATNPGARLVLGDGLAYYRIALPLGVQRGRGVREGTWNVLLRLSDEYRRKAYGDMDATEIYRNARRGTMPGAGDRVRRVAIPYQVIVHAYTGLDLHLHLGQKGFDPGAPFTLEVDLSQFGIPLTQRIGVRGEIQGPGGRVRQLRLIEVEPGRFTADAVAAQPGAHQIRVRASGVTLAGHPFEREQTRTIAVWHGGDREAACRPSGGEPIDRWKELRLFRLLDRLLEKGGLTAELAEELREHGVDLDELRRYLQGDPGGEGQHEHAPRAGGRTLVKELAGLWRRIGGR